MQPNSHYSYGFVGFRLDLRLTFHGAVVLERLNCVVGICEGFGSVFHICAFKSASNLACSGRLAMFSFSSASLSWSYSSRSTILPEFCSSHST